MIYETINLKKYFPNLINDVNLISYCQDNYGEFSLGKERKCLIVLPGGAYAYLSDREAEPVCLRFMGANIAVFLLKYSVAQKIQFPSPLEDVLTAVAYIRNNAEKYHINKNSISVLGFSAGGHLAALSSCYYDFKDILDRHNLKEDDTKINGCLLGYPVISTSVGHEESFENATKGNGYLLDMLSVEKHVTKKFPQTFIYHTALDDDVNVENSLLLASALRKQGIPFEMHIYPRGGHGSSLADSSVYKEDIDPNYIKDMEPNTAWSQLAIDFIKRYI